jgi:dTDP-glucose 4,6-dehydratase
MVLNVAAMKELPVYGDGMQVRDWLHVEDHCEGLLVILDKGAAGETYCIGGNNEQANIDIVRQICDIVDARLGRPPGTGRTLIRHVEDRLGHDRRYAINAKKMRDQLGWTPKRRFEDALGENVDWYLSHESWIDSIRSGEYLTYYDEQYGSRLDASR